MATGWIPAEMKDKWVLDVGCGSGRFAEAALSSAARVVALESDSKLSVVNSEPCDTLIEELDRGDEVRGSHLLGQFGG